MRNYESCQNYVFLRNALDLAWVRVMASIARQCTSMKGAVLRRKECSCRFLFFYDIVVAIQKFVVGLPAKNVK